MGETDNKAWRSLWAVRSVAVAARSLNVTLIRPTYGLSDSKSGKLMIGLYSDPIPCLGPAIELRPALPNRTSVVPKSPGVCAPSSPTVNMSPSISGNVCVGSRTSSEGVLVKYKRWSASSAAYVMSQVSEASLVERETILGIQPSLTNSRSLPQVSQYQNRHRQQRQVCWTIDQSLLVI